MIIKLHRYSRVESFMVIVLIAIGAYSILSSTLATTFKRFVIRSIGYTDTRDTRQSVLGNTSANNFDFYNIRTSLNVLVDLPSNFNVSERPTFMLRHTILLLDRPGWFPVSLLNDTLPQCAYSNCHLSTNVTYLHNASVLVFYYVMSRGQIRIPPINVSTRNPDQAWVFYSLEPPPRVNAENLRSRLWQNQFNWSMNYRLDSDVLASYGLLKSRTSVPSKNYTAIFKQKTGMAAWIVSHCKTASGREKYVKGLQGAGIGVDIFGKCGTRKLTGKKVDIVLTQYKFYLSFENTFCKDYITEKMFNKYNNDLILIVRGGADYNKLIPTKTFINTNDFKSPNDLAKFMLSLASDEEAYTNFLRRKDRYESLVPWSAPYIHGVCELCEKINNINSNRNIYKDPYNYIKTNHCFLPSDN